MEFRFRGTDKCGAGERKDQAILFSFIGVRANYEHTIRQLHCTGTNSKTVTLRGPDLPIPRPGVPDCREVMHVKFTSTISREDLEEKHIAHSFLFFYFLVFSESISHFSPFSSAQP